MLTLKDLNKAQREAVTAPDGPTLVVAGAGSGKTRTVASRIAWLAEQGVSPASMLLLTFTRKASLEMLQRAESLVGYSMNEAYGGTFHGIAFSILRKYKPAWATGPITVMDPTDAAASIQHCKENLAVAKKDRSFPKTQTILNLFSKSRNKETSFLTLLQKDAPHLMLHSEELASLTQEYGVYKRQRNLLDYDDLLFELEALLKGDLEKNIPPIAPELQERFRYIMIDEYQDTNRVQARIVRLLAGENTSIMAVGDEAQSIYAFRGADVHNILDFPQLFPGTKIIRLEENYRSTQPILDVANALLTSSNETFHKRLFTTKTNGKPPRLIRSLSDLTQANLIAERILELLNEHRPNDIAVLFRAGYQSYHLELALAKRDVAFRKYGGLKYTEAAHIKDVLAFTRLLINPLDMPSFLRLASFSKGVGPKTAQKLYLTACQGNQEELKKNFSKYPTLLEDIELLDALRQQKPSPTEMLNQIIERYHPRLVAQYPEDWPRREQGLEELTHIASAYADIEQFIADLSLETPEPNEAEEQTVALSTIHSAKGLEWDVVIILDLVEDRFPSRHALVKSEDFEEERRLMYVACTRAREQLELSMPMTLYNKQFGSSEPAVPSPFIREIPSSLLEEWQEGYSGKLYKKGKDVLIAEPKDLDQLAPSQSQRANPQKNLELSYSFCKHKIFGRGKIVEHLLPDKCRVNFPGFGLKVILKEYLTLEE